MPAGVAVDADHRGMTGLVMAPPARYAVTVRHLFPGVVPRLRKHGNELAPVGEIEHVAALERATLLDRHLECGGTGEEGAIPFEQVRRAIELEGTGQPGAQILTIDRARETAPPQENLHD